MDFNHIQHIQDLKRSLFAYNNENTSCSLEQLF